MLELHTVGDAVYLEGTPEELANIADLAQRDKSLDALVKRIDMHFDKLGQAAHAAARADYEVIRDDPKKATWQEPPPITRMVKVMPAEIDKAQQLLSSGHQNLPIGAQHVAELIGGSK